MNQTPIWIPKQQKREYRDYTKLDIVSVKNIKHKGMKKVIPLGDARLNNGVTCIKPDCPCRVVNPLRLLNLLMERIGKFKPIANILCWKNKQPVKTTEIQPIIDEIVSINGLNPEDDYTPYSTRIGGCTESVMKQIPEPMIYKFIGWSDSNLKKIHHTYSKFTELQLSAYIGYLIHGYKGKHCITSTPVFDPWKRFPDPDNF
eukprot:46841_1